MRIGIVGYQGSGKSTLFAWLTQTPAEASLAHTTQSAMATVPEPRVAGLVEVYHPKKVTMASLELVDTPGLSRTHEGSAAKLAMIRESGCLIVVVAAFGGNDALADLRNLDDDFLIADLDIVGGRIERLRESLKKPRPDRDKQQLELDSLLPLHAVLEEGRALREMELNPAQQQAIRSFQLFTEKPRLVVVNLADDDPEPQRICQQLPADIHAVALPLALELGLSTMEESERAEFCREMEIEPADREGLLRRIMEVSRQMLFFTAGEKEVRTWLIRRGGTAHEAAASVHTDLARGFIRAEVMHCDDLIRLGSERDVKAHGLVRHEPKDYVIQEGDILLIRHN